MVTQRLKALNGREVRCISLLFIAKRRFNFLYICSAKF